MSERTEALRRFPPPDPNMLVPMTFAPHVPQTVPREKTFADVKHELVGSFRLKQEAEDEAAYWRKRGYRARIVPSFTDERPYHLYVSISRR